MPKAARLNDSVAGTTAGEHTGHVHPHSPEPFGGQISGGCSGNVFINGRPAATVGERHNGDGRLLGSSQGRWPPGADPSTSTGSQPPGWGRHPGRTQRCRGGGIRQLRRFHRG